MKDLEKLVKAMQEHEQISKHTQLKNIIRIYEGDLQHLYEPIINNNILSLDNEVKEIELDFSASSHTYTAKPRIKMIDFLGVKVPEPMREHLKTESYYYFRNGDGIVARATWDSHPLDKKRFVYGIYPTKELCQAFCDAINPILQINP